MMTTNFTSFPVVQTFENTFTGRIVDIWNRLPQEIINNSLVNIFFLKKDRLLHKAKAV